MGFWNGNLRNSPLDVTIDLEVLTTQPRFHQTNPFSSVLLVAIVAAYLPQIARIVRHGSTQGISPYFVLCNAIYSNIQFAHALLFAAYAYPTTQEPVLALVSDGKLTGSGALGGILGLLQVALQWSCSITLTTLFASYPSSSKPASPSNNKASTAIAAIAFTHAALFLFPAMLIALPKPSPREMGTAIFIGFTLIVNTWVALFFVLWQFYPQYLEMRRMSGAPGALSFVFLAFQAVVILAIAVRWLLRLGAPTWGDQSVPLWYWYKWGNLPFSYILHGIGCAVLLSAYLVTRHRGGRQDLETEAAPLLA